MRPYPTPALVLTTALSLTATLVSQPPVPGVREDEALVVELAGPAALHQAFLATNVGGLLAAREAASFWSRLGSPLAKHTARYVGFDPTPLWGALRTYRGRITIALSPDPESAWFEGVVVLAPDGKISLGDLAARFGVLLRAGGGQPRTFRIGEHEVTSYAVPGSTRLTAPLIHQDHLMVFFGADIARSAPERWSEKRAAESSKGVQKPATRASASTKRAASPDPIVVRAELKRLIARTSLYDWLGGKAFADSLGFGSLDKLRIGVRPRGPNVEMELAIEFSGDERGVFGGFMPASTEPPQLIHLIPEDHRDWAASKIDLSTLAGTIVDALIHGTPQLVKPGEYDDLLELFATLDDDYVQLGSLIGDETFLGEFCLALAVRDTDSVDAALATTLGCDPLLDRAGIESGRVAEHEINAAGKPLFFARWRNLLFLHHGKKGRAWFDQMLARARATGRSGKPRARSQLPPVIARLGPGKSGPGVHGYGRIDVRHLARALPGLWLLWPRATSESASELWSQLAGELVPHLEQFELDTAALVNAWQRPRWSLRVVW